MDEPRHNGLLWEKVAEMNLPERELIASFDSEEDFVNYMSRAPKIAWESVKGSKLEKLKAKGEAMDDHPAPKDEKPTAKAEKPKEKTSLADIKKRVEALEAADAD